jgi:hypothetical protein
LKRPNRIEIKMDAAEFRRAGRQMIDFVADYLENIRERPVLPSVAPFYIRDVVPESAPEKPESWQSVFADIEPVIMQGVCFFSFLFGIKNRSDFEVITELLPYFRPRNLLSQSATAWQPFRFTSGR